uniref:Isthmin-1-like n=1 Tax=Saccoglossus kowalevskii TaxID=10224 RepID=A0ABM0GP08_SACKO|nr:PREDICTED: isthmin-1-like [Saccoglossus kowalevskii]
MVSLVRSNIIVRLVFIITVFHPVCQSKPLLQRLRTQGLRDSSGKVNVRRREILGKHSSTYLHGIQVEESLKRSNFENVIDKNIRNIRTPSEYMIEEGTYIKPRTRHRRESGVGPSRDNERKRGRTEVVEELPRRHNHGRTKGKKRKRERNRNRERRKGNKKERNTEKNRKHELEGRVGVDLFDETIERKHPPKSEQRDDPTLGDVDKHDQDYVYDYLSEDNRFAPNMKGKKETNLISENDSAPKDYAKLFQNSDLAELGSPDLTRTNPNIEVTIEILHENYTEMEKDNRGPNDFPVGQIIDFEELANAFQNIGNPGGTEDSEKTDVLINSDADIDGMKTTGTQTTFPQDDINLLDNIRTSSPRAFTEQSDEYGFSQTDTYQGVMGGQQLVDFDRVTGDWSEWIECSVTCGGGTKRRQRSCGNSCISTETQDCIIQPCPEETPESDSEPGDADAMVEEQFGLLTHLASFTDDLEHDSCEAWMTCKNEFLLSYLSRLQELPSCPCVYPIIIAHNSSIWDQQKQKTFNWMDASGEKLNIYKPTASHCIRSKLSVQSTSLAAQHCCYDSDMILITRGPGAGTPNLISTEVSYELHYKIDIMPWIHCKGDWTRYNQVRPPNNMAGCIENPDTRTFVRLYQEAKIY